MYDGRYIDCMGEVKGQGHVGDVDIGWMIILNWVGTELIWASTGSSKRQTLQCLAYSRRTLLYGNI
jgi:hypothetical protein